MGTNRSLNKLEFKAHMSIHDKVAVLENESHEPYYTRDRFGKKHRVRPSRPPRTAVIGLVSLLLLVADLLLSQNSVIAKAGGNTNVRVESSALDESTLDAKLNVAQTEKPFFYQEGSASVGFNEDGDPNMSLRF